MGIYSRDYMKEKPRRGPGLRGQMLTVQLIVANVVVFVLWQLAQSDDAFLGFMKSNFRVSADGVIHGLRIHTLITSAFSHEGVLHILFNMLFLYWFGRDVEEIYGRKDFLLLYLASGVVASLAHVVLQLVVGHPEVPALGASGAVMGIVVVFACFYPNRRVYFYGIFPIAIKWLAILYVAIDVVGVLHANRDPVAHGAHLGGALTGYLFYKLDLRLFSRGLVRRRPQKFQLRDHHERLDPAIAARVDALLEKIALHGKDSLTEEERAFLVEASRSYRS